MRDRAEGRTSAATAVRRRMRTPVTVGVAVLLVGVLATTALVGWSVADTRQDVAAHLDRTADDIDVLVSRRIETAQSALLTMAAQVSTGVASPREIQWVLANTGVVEEVPGLLAMLYAQATETEDGARVAPRAVHPLAPNVGVLGRNLLDEPERRRAVEAARDSGRSSATGLVVHADGGADAILVMVPVFEGSPTSVTERRAAFGGVMIAVVSPDELFADVSRLPVVASVIDLAGEANDPGVPVPVWGEGAPPPQDAHTHAVRIADRTWQLAVAPAEGFPVTSNAAVVVGVAGVLLSILLGLLAATLVGRRERLARLVDERTRELRQANVELERAGRLRSQFITTVSHELRTPLTSVIGFIQTVRRMRTDDPDLREEFLGRAEHNALTLRRMIEDLLDFGRLERGEVELDLRPSDVAVVVAATVRDLEPTLDGRRILLHAGTDAWAEVDREAMGRIVANLVSNSMQHAPGEGPIDVVVRRVAETVEVVCLDRGPGFLERDLPALFERFVRGSGVMGEGTGIGLAVVRDLTLAHGGDVELANRPDGGAEVTVTLPACAAPARTRAVTGREPAPFVRALSEVD